MTGSDTELGPQSECCADGLRALGRDAWDRGDYRDAVQKFKTGAGRGDAHAAALLIGYMHALHPGDDRPARWGVAHAFLACPAAVDTLLGNLLAAGADAQVAALLDRNPAAHVALDSVAGVCEYLEGMNARMPSGLDCERKARDQVLTLARRAGSEMSLHDSCMVALLLNTLDDLGTEQDVAELLARDPVADVVFGSPYGINELMAALTIVDGRRHLVALAERVALHLASMPLEDPREIASLVGNLDEVRADTDRAQAEAHMAVLLGRDPAAHVSLEDPTGVAQLLVKLVAAGEREQAGVLARRAMPGFPLREPSLVAVLLDLLRGPGLAENLRVILARGPADQVLLEEPGAVAHLLGSLHVLRAYDQIAALLARSPADTVSLEKPFEVAFLLKGLRRVAADDQIAALLARNPAACVDIDTPHDVDSLLTVLLEEKAPRQVDILLERLPEPERFSLLKIDGRRGHADLDRPREGTQAQTWGWDDLV